MPKIARIGDQVSGTCTCHDKPITVNGTITTGASKTNAETQSIARVGDTVTASCGHTGEITSGSSSVFVEGKAVARVGDPFSGCFSGTIQAGASTVGNST